MEWGIRGGMGSFSKSELDSVRRIRIKLYDCEYMKEKKRTDEMDGWQFSYMHFLVMELILHRGSVEIKRYLSREKILSMECTLLILVKHFDRHLCSRLIIAKLRS